MALAFSAHPYAHIASLFQVAFIHIDRQMILTIHNHVITRIPRFTITHDKHFTWSLKIQNVQKEDKGFYMCQVNTDPMVSKVGYLDVVGTKPEKVFRSIFLHKIAHRELELQNYSLKFLKIFSKLVHYYYTDLREC